jgi:hypothetical protein
LIGNGIAALRTELVYKWKSLVLHCAVMQRLRTDWPSKEPQWRGVVKRWRIIAGQSGAMEQRRIAPQRKREAMTSDVATSKGEAERRTAQQRESVARSRNAKAWQKSAW